MANGKATITDIKLDNISVNLSDYLSDIRNYEGFQDCNSPFIGGKLQNTYSKKNEIQEDHKLIRYHNGDIWTIKNASVYKNYNLVYDFGNSFYTITDGDNGILPSWFSIKEKEGFLEISVTGKTVKDYVDLSTYTYSLHISGEHVYVQIAEMFSTQPTSWKDKLHGYDCTESNITSISHPTVRLNQKVATQANFDAFYTAANNIQYDCTGLIREFTDTDQIRKISVYLGVSSYEYKQPLECVDPVSGYHSRGEKIATGRGDVYNPPTEIERLSIDTLYYNKNLYGLSCNGNVITYDVSRVIYSDPSRHEMIYLDSNGNMKTAMGKIDSTYSNVIFDADDDYIYMMNTINFENTIDMKTGKVFSRSFDYNDRCLLSNATGKKGLYATAANANIQVRNSPSEMFSTLFPATFYELGTDIIDFPLEKDIVESKSIDLYLPTEDSIVPVYNHSHKYYSLKLYVPALTGTLYPMSENGSTLYCVPASMKFSKTYVNERLGKDGNFTYILAKNNKQNNIFGYYDFTESELDNLFLVQGSFYGVNDKYIFNVSIADNVISIDNVVANKLDLQFLGAFPTMALFYSKLDKSIYSFTGDAILQKIKEAYRIEKIYKTFCDPARLTLLVTTDIGLVVIYQNQTFLIEGDYSDTDNLYYDNNSYIVGKDSFSLSYNDELEPNIIKFRTEFYGIGSNIKSVNDCIYIRLEKGKLEDGYIKIKSYTLGEKTTESKEKVIKLDKNSWDKITNSLLVRYQPQNQSGVGISIEVETTNPIVSMSVGHSVEAVQNTAYNL